MKNKIITLSKSNQRKVRRFIGDNRRTSLKDLEIETLKSEIKLLSLLLSIMSIAFAFVCILKV